MTTRAKFRCNSVEFRGDHTDENTPRTYNLSPVYDTSTPENARFTKATPWGELKLNVDNPDARFEVGQFYYVDFTPADG
ncbi:hypothetical protein ACIBBG_16290 [Micromonospora chersina]|uniref:hypothetical protein n=1 Tax=Micromonospora chersina TaxID=47854 RepID=UPI0037887485